MRKRLNLTCRLRTAFRSSGEDMFLNCPGDNLDTIVGLHPLSDEPNEPNMPRDSVCATLRFSEVTS